MYIFQIWGFDLSLKNRPNLSNRSSRQLFPSYFNINAYRNRKGIIEVIPIFSILQPEAFAELNFCLQIPSGVRLFVFFFFFDEIVESTLIEVSFNWNTRYHRGSLYKCDKMYKQNLDSKIETSKKKATISHPM